MSTSNRKRDHRQIDNERGDPGQWRRADDNINDVAARDSGDVSSGIRHLQKALDYLISVRYTADDMLRLCCIAWCRPLQLSFHENLTLSVAC